MTKMCRLSSIAAALVIVSNLIADTTPKSVHIRVYDVKDLIISIPTFPGRPIDISQIGQQNQQGGLGGARFLSGVGGGGNGGGNLFQGGNDQEDDNNEDNLHKLLDLIQSTIAPESWRAAGGNVGEIKEVNQQVIITQTATSHQQIRDL